MLQACMQGNFFKNLENSVILQAVNLVELHCILHFALLQLNLKINTTSSPTRPLCIYTLFSQQICVDRFDVITAFQIGR